MERREYHEQIDRLKSMKKHRGDVDWLMQGLIVSQEALKNVRRKIELVTIYMAPQILNQAIRRTLYKLDERKKHEDPHSKNAIHDTRRSV